MSIRTITTVLLVIAICFLVVALSVYIVQNIHVFTTPIQSPAPNPLRKHW
jgi:hypothetical protein